MTKLWAQPPASTPSSQRWLKFTRMDTDSLVLSAVFCVLVVLFFVAESDDFLHWFILPVWVCGVLVGIDAVDWFRGRLTLLDPVGLIAIVGLHFFFLAPLLHVAWQYWMPAPSPPLDWRASLGGMAIFNCLGLLAYRYTRDFFLVRGPSPQQASQPTYWRLDKSRFVFFAVILLIMTAVLQINVYRQYGGVVGYMQEATSLEQPNPMAGMGWVFLVSESFPMVALMLFAVKSRGRNSWLMLTVVMLVFLVTRLFFGGLRGSRTTILYSLFWAVGVLHLYVRLIPRQVILVGVGFMVVFMYGYGLYKGAGPQAFQTMGSASGRAELEATTHRDYQSVILGDLSRSDVQAYILDRLWSPNNKYLNNYRYAWGRTYLGAMSLLIPHALWPDRPDPKVREGTEILFGMGTYKEGEVWSSKLYGLAGETMLNFGPLPIPLAFAFFGLIVSAVRRQLFTLRDGDSRLFLFPLLVLLCVNVLTADSDNALFFIIQFAGVPGLLLMASTVWQRETISRRSGNRAITA